MNPKVIEQIKTAPKSSGVYVFKDNEAIVIYVGKANNLNNRLKSYLQKGEDSKGIALRDNISSLELVTTSNSIQALILEANLIKKYRPKYNVLLKDDKAFQYIRINKKEAWPRLELTRRVTKDGASYFGPYTSSRELKYLLGVLNRTFPLRKCKNAVFKVAKRPCINYQMGLCLAPCSKELDKSTYLTVLDFVEAVLKGNIEPVINGLEKEMLMASDSLDFERATNIRESIKSLVALKEKRAVIITKNIDVDLISYLNGSYGSSFAISFVRRGLFSGQANFIFADANKEEALRRLLIDHYLKNFIPDEIYLPFQIDYEELLDLVKTRSEKKVKLKLELTKDLKKLNILALRNLELYAESYSKEAKLTDSSLEELRTAIGATESLSSIECYDMSNISGTNAVGAKLAFQGAKPIKDAYRKYKIKGSFKGDDLKMIYEVLSRRIKDVNSDPLADIVLIDGGKTQLKVAYQVFKNLGVYPKVLCSIAKDKTRSKTLSLDKIYHIDSEGLIFKLTLSLSSLQLLKQVRDKTHDFVIRFHRITRSKGFLGK